MQLHLANWCARCVYVCMCVLERESGREGVWVDLSVVFFLGMKCNRQPVSWMECEHFVLVHECVCLLGAWVYV